MGAGSLAWDAAPEAAGTVDGVRIATGVLAFCLLLLVGAGIAEAATITGSRSADRLRGTAEADTLRGLGGADFLDGGRGRDTLDGGPADDLLEADDGTRDIVRCGPGRDVVEADRVDLVGSDCEVVSRRLSRDPYRNRESQHETQVEPDSFAHGSTIVTVFQVGRIRDGGAANIGWATSLDGGRTWRSGFLPALTVFSTPAGVSSRVSDPVVAYDAVHRVWLASSLGVSPGVTHLYVSRSSDGTSWSAPVSAARAETGSLAYDKEWVACDNWASSPFAGRCYLSYTELAGRRLSTQATADGGITWSGGAGVPGSGSVSGAQPVARPDGTLHVLHVNPSGVAVARSTDGGATFGRATLVATLEARALAGMRSPSLPSVETDGAGRIYAAWHDCHFQPDCRANDIVVTSSSDGVVWSPATRAAAAPGVSRFVAGLGVDPATRGSSTRLTIAYYSAPRSCPLQRCRLTASFVSSADAGASWTPPQRVSVQPMPLSWIAETTQGRMVGDYVSTSYAEGRPVAVFSLASARRGSSFQQFVYAARLPDRPLSIRSFRTDRPASLDQPRPRSGATRSSTPGIGRSPTGSGRRARPGRRA